MIRNLRQWSVLLILSSPLLAAGQFRKSAGATIEDATREAARKATAKDADSATAEKPDSPTAEKPDSSTTVKVLTDIKGFNLQNLQMYLDAVMPRIRSHWWSAVSELVRKPDRRHGTVVVEMSLVRSGEIQDVHVVESSEERDLDEAVLQGVWRASPVQPLPKAYLGNELKLRLHFFYKGKPSWWRGE